MSTNHSPLIAGFKKFLSKQIVKDSIRGIIAIFIGGVLLYHYKAYVDAPTSDALENSISQEIIHYKQIGHNYTSLEIFLYPNESFKLNMEVEGNGSKNDIRSYSGNWKIDRENIIFTFIDDAPFLESLDTKNSEGIQVIDSNSFSILENQKEIKMWDAKLIMQ